MKLIPSIFTFFMALNRINGAMDMMSTMYMFNMSTTEDDMDMGMSTTDDMDTSTSTTMYTTVTLVSEADLEPDDNPFDDTCLFGLSSAISLLDGEDSYVDICGTSMEDRVLINVEVTIPAEKWVAVGFQDEPEEDQSLMMGYAVVIPIYSRDLIEIYMSGPVGSGTAPGEVLESTITVISDKIADNLRTIVFQRYATIKYEDLTETSDNLFNVNNERYYDFGGLTECDAETTVIYAFGPMDGKRFSSYVYHGSDNRGSVIMTIDTTEDEECEINFDSANQYMIMVTFIISSIIAILL